MQEDPPKSSQVRFEATVHGENMDAARGAVADLDLDRLPDTGDVVRVLIGPDDLAGLVGKGYEVRLLKAYPVQPLDKSLIMDDEAAEAWLERQTRGITREEKS